MQRLPLFLCALILLSPTLRATPAEDFTTRGKELGPKFDLRAFHDEVLKNGALPLSVLEAHMKEWVAKRKSA